ncbi:YcjF family protein [Synechococcus sp. CBW1004]|uniref:YcjF family protein n=1 Tax=Synechococcus sp. CBW1004 TaxID=1353136 RepID=UPI0018CD8DBC|nr:YcjF family protein [Synechococcus sp. CBW1004]QPN63278.1 YcjF family protein [Synechococcus sp. CBW1004]
MTTSDPTSAPSLPGGRPVLGGLPWRRPALALAGTLVLSEGVARWIHLDGGALLGLGALAGGWWLLSRRRPQPGSRLPGDVDGWIQRCQEVLPRFAQLAGEDDNSQSLQRQAEFTALLQEIRRGELAASLVSCRPPAADLQPTFATALRCSRALRLQWGEPLPTGSDDWSWPESFAHSDVLLYHLHWPLSAADLRWLEALPEGQPAWLLLQLAPRCGTEATLANAALTDDGLPDAVRSDALLCELASQWPGLDRQRCLLWDGTRGSLATALEPLALWLRRSGERQRQQTAVRVLAQLHERWQADLEGLRRMHWQRLQQRTQWLVAAGVLASPLPSLDLLVLAAANGLMLQEMARLWDCSWDLETLRAAATELARAALALGLVEWSSQALLTAARLHGATWLVGGTLQALSAAYLTRVVGHAMADVLALSSGVAEADLAAIRRQAPMLVSRAAEAERIDWNGFLQQGRQWLQHSISPAATA